MDCQTAQTPAKLWLNRSRLLSVGAWGACQQRPADVAASVCTQSGLEACWCRCAHSAQGGCRTFTLARIACRSVKAPLANRVRPRQKLQGQGKSSTSHLIRALSETQAQSRATATLVECASVQYEMMDLR